MNGFFLAPSLVVVENRGHEWLDESLRNKNYALDSREI